MRDSNQSSPLWDFIEENLEVVRKRATGTIFSEVVKTLGTVLLPWFLRRCLPGSDAEDCVAETIKKIVFRIDPFEWRGEGSFRAWCFTIAENVRRDWLRAFRRRNSRSAEPEQINSLADPVSSNGQEEADPYDFVRVAFAQLTEREQEILDLKIIQGRNHKDVAKRLGITEVAARKALERAKAQLADKIPAGKRPVKMVVTQEKK